MTLLYKNGEPAITGVQIFSTPGKREYIAYKKLKPVLGGMGYSFLSTPKGIMTDKESKKANWEENYYFRFGNMSKIGQKPVIVPQSVSVDIAEEKSPSKERVVPLLYP